MTLFVSLVSPDEIKRRWDEARNKQKTPVQRPEPKDEAELAAVEEEVKSDGATLTQRTVAKHSPRA